MLLYTKKQMEKEVDRRMMEVDEKRWLNERMDRFEKEIAEVNRDLWQLRVKVDPEFKARMTPTCGSDCCTKAP